MFDRDGQAEIEKLVRDMVGIPSINGTPGEKDIAIFIEGWLRSLPYFHDHPDFVYIQPIDGDSLERRNVFALLKGTAPGAGQETIILHGHTDTVGVDDFGRLAPYAFDCSKLQKEMAFMELDPEIRSDLDSGDWMFGRGVCDMKSGDAVFMVILGRLSAHPELLSGNILVSFNPVEENQHTGIIYARTFFEKLAEREGLVYRFAINNDYICPLYPGDTGRYVYTGTVGKLLPCFYIQGKETHAGQPFEGVDAGFVAAELVREISFNPEFCDTFNGATTLPPVALKSADLKERYNVQTPLSAFVYFNYMVHNESVPDIEEHLLAAVRRCCMAASALVDQRYEAFKHVSGVSCPKAAYDFDVTVYSILYDRVRSMCGVSLDKILHDVAERLIAAGTDSREISLALVRKVCELGDIRKPVVVLFFAAPYCPHNTIQHTEGDEAFLYRTVRAVLTSCGEKNREQFTMLPFFPSLSDSSYLKIDDDNGSIDTLVADFPGYDMLYPVDLHKIKELDIPCFNFGCYGKDAHKSTERVYKPYSFGVLPELIMDTVAEFFGTKQK